jgi:dolichol-phosphate mannosyltransferase
MKTVVFIPVYNQVQQLPSVLDDLQIVRDWGIDLLLVNNGSTDGSEGLCRGSGHAVLEIPKNLGVGYSYIHALDWALEREYEVFCTMASNGKMLARNLPTVLEPIQSGKADYVTGSRFLAGGDSPNLPSFRKTSIPMVNWFVRFTTGGKLTDATCGFRALRLDLMRRAQFDWHAPWLYTYSFEYYLYAKVILDRKILWTEVPVTMKYPAQKRKYSHIRPGVDWWAMLRPWLWARLNRKGFAPADDSGPHSEIQKPMEMAK